MLNDKQFNSLWQYLLSNSWDFLPDKERLKSMKTLFYNNLKDYDYNQVFKAFDSFIHNKDVKKLPLIQSIIANIESAKEHSNYQASKPFQSKDKRLHKLYKRMVQQARHTLKAHGNNRQLLAECGIKYENLKCKIFKKPATNRVHYHGKTFDS